MRIAARTLSPSIAVALALALVCEGLGIAAPKPPPAPPKVKVNVDSTPQGATVYLDAKSGDPLGKTPLKAVGIPKGAHKLLFTLDRWEDAELAIDVKKAGETFTAKLEQLAMVELTSASNGSAQSATVAIDGVALGKIPFSKKIQPGRHELRITKPRFQDYAQWFEIAGGETRAQVITLEPIRVAGSLLIAGDVPGADVLVDGTPRGQTPVVVDNLDAGTHSVEIRAKDLPAWAQTVAVKAGERTTVNPTIRPQKAAAGSLRVLSNVEGAQVVLDGEPLGKVPADAASIAPGTHILELVAPKYKHAHQEVVIVAGERKVVRIELEALPEKTPTGTLRVTSFVPGALIYLDGAAVGSSPFERSDITAGEHFVAVEASGYKKWQSSVKIEDGKRSELAAELKAIASLVVTSSVAGAVVRLDGSVVGKTPVESGEIAAGTHQVTVSADGYLDKTETIELKAGEKRHLAVGLEAKPLPPKPVEVQTMLTSWGAGTLSQGKVSVDVALGWPYLVDARLGVGVVDHFDAGVGVRTLFRSWEFVARARLATRLNVLGLGLYAEGGGGLGTSGNDPNDQRNVFFAEGGPMATLFFGDRAAFTLRLPLEYFSEKCVATDHPALTACPAGQTRQEEGRVRLGGLLEVAASDKMNVFGLFEGVLVGEERKGYQDLFGLENRDRKLYFKVGLTFKL